MNNPLNQIEMSLLLYDIMEARQEDLVFKTGPVKRLFLDKEFREAVIELRSGQTDYALDVGPFVMNEALEAYEREYPQEYEAFMEARKAKPFEPSYLFEFKNKSGNENNDDTPN